MIAAIDSDLFSIPSYGIEIKNHQRLFLLISQLPDSDADRIGPPVPDLVCWLQVLFPAHLNVLESFLSRVSRHLWRPFTYIKLSKL